MSDHLYPDFLEDHDAYQASVAYWTRLWEGLIGEIHADGWATPWLYSDLRDGNPIFSAVSQDQRRGVRIIQHPPTRYEADFVPWIDTFDGDTPIQELVISCALSTETAGLATRLLRTWIKK